MSSKTTQIAQSQLVTVKCIGATGAGRGKVKSFSILLCNYCKNEWRIFCSTTYYSGSLFCTTRFCSLLNFAKLSSWAERFPSQSLAELFLWKRTKIFQLCSRYFERKINILSKLMDIDTLLKNSGGTRMWDFLFLFLNLKCQMSKWWASEQM